ncbi:uncharacterized protein DUF4169 [Aestuariispira insulae]|uniref:Uncharacterized protein DUF4169 n=2 Tax=Aestuariispira insulae TaxID=1461337 RepID=A0A3D9HJL3_9PROT|nr:uncharacterized protein DUF4169 [Aestuariispira insulae]
MAWARSACSGKVISYPMHIGVTNGENVDPMAEIINLRQARKQQKRRKKEGQAEENRARFGRTKAEKTKETQEAERIRRELDGKKREGDGQDD